jgi:hypothetical protein
LKLFPAGEAKPSDLPYPNQRIVVPPEVYDNVCMEEAIFRKRLRDEQQQEQSQCVLSNRPSMTFFSSYSSYRSHVVYKKFSCPPSEAYTQAFIDYYIVLETILN